MSAVALFGLASIAACGGPSTKASAQPDAVASCPATPNETVGVACSVPGLRCGPQYACGILPASLLCVCTGGLFACTDGAGRPVAQGDKLTCPPGAPSASCPLSESSANLAACTEQGLLCAYPSACPGRFDQCQCFPGTTAGGGFGLRFECTPAACGGQDAGSVVFDSGKAPDSGPDADSSRGFDSSTDSPVESAADAPIDGDTSTGDARPE